MTDPPSVPSATGFYFFKIEPPRTSVVFLKNVTNSPQRYNLIVRYDGGSWVPGLQVIGPRQALAIDIAHLRDAGTRDTKGHVIPPDVTSGQVHWSIMAKTDPKGILGRMEQPDFADGVSSTYACTGEIDDYYYSSRIDPDSSTVGVGGDDAYYTVYETDATFVGDDPEEEYAINDDLDWSSDDTGVAVSDGDGYFAGVGNDTTSVYASGNSEAPTRESLEGGDEYDYQYGDISQSASLQSQQCLGDSDRSAIRQEYVNYHNAHTNFFSGGIPSCADFSNSRSSSAFSFAQLNTGDYSVALLRAPLIAAASSDHGLDRWVAQYGASRTVNSAFRNPARNTAVGGQAADSSPGGHTGSRHMYGDAADLNNVSGTLGEWNDMVTAANNSDPDYVEPQSGHCGIACTHADWRNHSGGYQ